MKRLLTTTTALSVALSTFSPLPALAQTEMIVEGQTVWCLPNKAVECPEGAFCVVAKNPDNCERNALKALAAVAEAIAASDEAAKTEAQAATANAEADATAAAQAEADAAAAAAGAEAAAAAQAEADAALAAQAAADAAVAAQAEADAAQAAADAEAAAQAETDAAAAAQAEADAAATAAAAADADAAAAAQAEADKATAAQAEADAAAVQAAADAAAAAQADADAAAAAQAETDAAAAAQADADTAAAAQAEIDAAAAVQAETDAAATEAAEAEADAAAAAQSEADAAAAAAEAAAQATDEAVAETPALEVPVTEPVDIPVPTAEETDSLTAILDDSQPGNPAELGAAAGLEDPVLVEEGPVEEGPAEEGVVEEGVVEEGVVWEDPAPSPDATVTEEVVTEADIRSSTEEFAAAPVAVAKGKKSGLTDLEKVGLIALGALIVGAILKDGREVVSNSGDRVVVRQPDGSYVIYKDDDVLLRQPGSKVRTETFADGSTRTIVQREDGMRIVTIRDASGRVLRRAAYDQQGREYVLIDDLAPEQPIDVTTLPRPRADRLTISAADQDAALKARMAALEAQELGRSFSLRQIRDIREVRDLAATIDVETITFDTGSAAIRATEAEKLAELGGLISDLIAANPGEVFLIEGHTDAVGSAASNLALSDRRAESVAKALTEYFAVPPENLVVQGYGEAELRIDTQGDERANRRAAVRIITPLMRSASN